MTRRLAKNFINKKRIVKTKKRKYKHNTLRQMSNKRDTNPKYFWDMLKKISPNRNCDDGGIHANSFAEYFKTILT